MSRKRSAPVENPPESAVENEAPPAEEVVTETAPEVEEAEAPAEEAHASVTLKGRASSVRRAAARFGRQAPPPQENGEEEVEDDGDGVYDNKYAEMLADGRNKIVVTRDFPTRYAGQRVPPIKVPFNCPIVFDRLCQELFESYGGQTFRIAIYPNTPTAESKPPLGAFTVENPETDEPWMPEDEGGTGGPTENDGYAPLDPTARADKSVAAVTTKALEQEAAALAQELEVKRLRRLRKQADREDEDPDKDPSEDRVSRLEEKLAIGQVESRMEKRIDSLAAIIEKMAQPKDNGNVLMVEMMKSSQQQFMAMMTAMQNSQAQMMTAIMQATKQPPKEDAFEHLEKLGRLKNLFGGENDKYSQLIDLALDKLFDNDQSAKDASDESDVKYAINKLEPLIQKLVDKKIEDGGKPKNEYTTEQIRAIQLEAAQKAAKMLEEEWVAKGFVVKPPPATAPNLPAPAAPDSKSSASAPAQPKPGERDMTNVPPAPGEPGYDRKKAVDFVLDTAVVDMKKGYPENEKSYLVWDIVDGLDAELLEQFSKVTSGEELDKILVAWGDPAKIAEVKRIGQDPACKTWLSRVVSTAQDIIQKKKAGVLK